MKNTQGLTPFRKPVTEIAAPAEPAVPFVSSSIYDYGMENQEDSRTQLLEYWRSVRKHLWLILGLVLLGTMLASVYAARQPDVYQAQARIQIDLENNPLQGVSGRNAPIFLSNPTSDPVYFVTQLQNLTSQSLLRRVAKTLDLERDQEFLNTQAKENASTWQLVLRMFGLAKKPPAAASDPTQDKVAVAVTPVSPVSDLAAAKREDLVETKRLGPYVGMLAGGLSVEPVRDTRMGYAAATRLIDIKYTHANPRVAARVVNALADVFIEANREKKRRTTSTNGGILGNRIAEVQEAIRKGEQEKLDYASKKGIISLTGEENTVVERLSGLNAQLLSAENDRKIAEAAYRANQAQGATEAKLEEDKRLTETEQELLKLRQKREQLLTDYTEEWPEVKETEGQIALLEKELSSLRSRKTTAAKTNLDVAYRQALQREEGLRKDYNEQRAKAQVQNQSAIQYKIIEEGIETNKNLLKGLTERQGEVSGAEETPNNVSVTDYAITNESPIGPRRMRSVVSAFLLSLVLGIGLALFLEYVNDTVRSTEDVERGLRLPALAVIPGLGQTGRRKLLPGAMSLQKRDNAGAELLLNMDRRSPLAEAYRHLRTSVLLSTAGHAPKTLLITSSLPSEGKTTTTVNLALSLAQTDASVLMIDADMRRPRLHSILEMPNRNGLSTILSRNCSEAEILSMVQQHEASGLYVLNAGPIPPNPAELLGSDQMRRVLKVFSNTFTHVVLDTPPTASFTDSVLLSTLVDGVLLVVHGGRSSRQVVRRTKQILQDVGAKILGVVLNNVNVQSSDYYYYYQQYYYKSYYGGEAEEEEVAEEVKSA